jgi:hypothetical protein
MRIPRSVIGLLLAVAACAPNPGSDDAVPTVKVQRDVLTREEIQNSPQGVLTLYAAIQALRPHFLSAPLGIRPQGASKVVAVYVNGTIQTGLEALQGITAGNVEEARYLDPMKAQSQFGPVASGGAILVQLRKPSADP